MDEHAELGVIDDVLEGELYVVADDHGYAVAGDGVEESVRRGRIAGNVETEFGGSHAVGGEADSVSASSAEGKVDVFLVLEQVEQLLPDESALRPTIVIYGQGKASDKIHRGY